MADAAAQGTRRVLVAADKFKGSLTAVEVAERVTAGLRRVVPDVEVEALPVADGWQAELHAAWCRAAVRQRDPGWSRALLGAPSAPEAGGPGAVSLAERARLLATLGAGERAEWSPDFSAKPLPTSVLGNATPADEEGARLFHSKGCEFCHAIEGYGGKRGPDLTVVGGRMTHDQIVARITNGSASMPAYARMLRPDEVQTLSEFLARRR